MLCSENSERVMAFSCWPNWKKWDIDNDCDILHLTKDSHKSKSKNTVLIGEIDFQNANEEILLSIGFGKTFSEAGNNAHSSLLNGFDTSKRQYIAEWKNWESNYKKQALEGKYLKESIAILKLSESKKFPGAIIASPSIPWEYSKESWDFGISACLAT